MGITFLDYYFKKIFLRVTQRRVFFFSFGMTIFTFVFSPICQDILNRKYCMRCHSDLKQVFVLLRGGESHCIWQRLPLAPLSLQSGFQWRKKCQHAACDKSSNQTHISSASYVGILSYLVLLSIMSTLERIDVLHHIFYCSFWFHSRECLQASTTEYSTTVITRIFLTSGRFSARDKCQYFDIWYINILLPQLSNQHYLL